MVGVVLFGVVAYALTVAYASGTVLSPAGEAVAQDGNPSQTGEASEDSVYGPLKLVWTKSFPRMVNQPLIADGRVLVNAPTSEDGYGSTIHALDPATGHEEWATSFEHTYFTSKIAYDSGVVVARSPSYGGATRSFDVDTGELLWEHIPESDISSGTVVADGGVAYISSGLSSIGRGFVTALRIEDGEVLWQSSRPGIDAGDDAMIALDADAVYVADECGGAVAFSRSSGAVVWSRFVPSQNRNCFGEDVMVHDGVVHAGTGHTYDAETGEPGPVLADKVNAATGGIGISGIGSKTSAFSLDGGEFLWTTPEKQIDDIVEPLVVAGHVYTARSWYFDDSSVLSVHEPRTGDLVYRTDLPYPGYRQGGGGKAGLAAGAGRLFLARGTTLMAFEPSLRPPANGLDLVVDHPDVLIDDHVTAWAGMGEKVSAPGKRVTFDTDVFPFGKPRRLAQKETDRNGTARVDYRLQKNTRFFARSTEGPKVTAVAFAYPRINLYLFEAGANALKAKTVVARLPRRVAGGRRVYAYYGHGGKRFEREGSDVLRVRASGSAVASPRVTPPRSVGASDVIAVCVEALPQSGYGRNQGLAGSCGKDVIRLDRAISPKKGRNQESSIAVRSAGPQGAP